MCIRIKKKSSGLSLNWSLIEVRKKNSKYIVMHFTDSILSQNSIFMKVKGSVLHEMTGTPSTPDIQYWEYRNS